MAAIIKELMNIYDVYVVGKSDPRSAEWFLMGSYAYAFGVLYLYFNFVLNWGPRFMKNREPFNLDIILRIYNLIQILLNVNILKMCMTIGWTTWWGYSFRWFCEPVDWSDSDHALMVTSLVWIFLMLKLTDLLDTVFFVLRKRERQITFLHLYHHAGMFFLVYCAVKYSPGGHFTFVGLVNSITHILMYGYYLLVNMSPQYRYIWWKKYLTQLQMVQFFIISVHSSSVLFMSRETCGTPRFHAFVMSLQTSVVFMFFADFYYKEYIKAKNK